MITYEQIKNNENIRIYITKADQALAADLASMGRKAMEYLRENYQAETGYRIITERKA